jgi:hypothetical protein
MHKLSAFLFFIICLSLHSEGQNTNISGSVEDTIQKKAVHNAVIAVLSAKDSVLYKFTRTDVTGKFSFKNLKPG